MSNEVESLSEFGASIAAAHPDAGIKVDVRFEELTLTVEPGHLVEVVRFLRDDPKCRFVSFVDLCGVDYPQRPKRFDVVLHLLSPKYNRRVRVKSSKGVLMRRAARAPQNVAGARARNWPATGCTGQHAISR